jgi:BirA family transcriptional regulator, biotin operon repressor / biotin---[acetyl-CoA-carboxylase] ligase
MIRPVVGRFKALGQHSLEAAVRAAGIEVPPVWRDESGSTNDDAGLLAAQGAPEWTVVAAGHQVGGRGRLGRSWSDVPGKALMFSVVLRPEPDPDRAPLLSLLVAVDLITSVGSPRLRSKWPNDLVVEDRKVGGILVDARVTAGRVEHAVAGIGLNLSMEPKDFPPEVRDRATSLRAQGIPADAGSILSRFLANLRVPREPAEILATYRPVCATLGRRVRAGTVAGDEVEGRAIDLDDRGSLVVETSDGARRVGFGEVLHLR